MPLFARSTFDDFDYAPDDDWLDQAFRVDESVGGIHGLIGSTALPARIPLDKILAPMVADKRVKFVAGWETRGAPVMGSMAGWLNHWTAGTPSTLRPNPSLGICTNGRAAGKGVSAVPGPLCNIYIGLTDLHVVASGRANHPGMGHQPLLAELRAGRLPLVSAALRKLPDTGGAGGAFGGTELEAPGNGKPITWRQWHLLIDSLACVAAWHGWTADRVAWHHALWTRRKVDYSAGKMPPWTGTHQFRDEIAARIDWARQALA
jgi:hypothetical protein